MLPRQGSYGALLAAAGVWATALAVAALAVAALAGCGGSAGSASSGRDPAADPVSTSAQPGPAASSPAAPAGSAPAPAAAPTGSATATATAAAPAPAGGGKIPPAHPVPASFRIAAGAPSDAEVRREVAQLRRIQRAERKAQTVQTLFSAAPDTAANLLPWDLEPKRGRQVSIASVFRDYGLGIACGGVLHANELGVAHKTAPCGTIITFRYAGRVLRLPVIDRGPYIAGREWDLTGAAADLLGFPGLGPIEWSIGPLRGQPVVTR